MARHGMVFTLEVYKWEVVWWCNAALVGRFRRRACWWVLHLSPFYVVLPEKNDKWKLWGLKENWAGMWCKVDPKHSSESGWRGFSSHKRGRVNQYFKGKHLTFKWRVSIYVHNYLNTVSHFFLLQYSPDILYLNMKSSFACSEDFYSCK